MVGHGADKVRSGNYAGQPVAIGDNEPMHAGACHACGGRRQIRVEAQHASTRWSRWWRRVWRRPAAEFRVVDQGGVVRLQRRGATLRSCAAGEVEAELRALLAELSEYGDAGRTIPDVFLLLGSRLVNLSGLADDSQLLGLAGVEVRAHAPDRPVVIIGTARAQ